jgi:hypothetical protein
MRRLVISLAVPFLLLTAACGDADDGGEADGGGGGNGIISIRLEPTEGMFVEGFEVGLRFDDPESGEEIDRQLWSDFVASLPPSDDSNAFYDSVYGQVVPAGVVRVGADVNIGIGPGPEPPDLDAGSLPCELDVEVGSGETVTVEVRFDDSVEDCLTVVEP